MKDSRVCDRTCMLQKQELASFAALIVVGIFLYYLYSFAEGLSWSFDDAHNLSGLSGVSDWAGIIEFVFGGNAGPTGRPVSLLWFIPNYKDWPDSPIGFVYGSLLWHTMNSGLVFIICLKVFRNNRGLYLEYPLWTAFIVAAVWAVLVIHSSSILMPVQRMTHVSAFFSLASIVFYLYWRTSDAKNHFRVSGIVLILLSALSFVLSVYAKENGIVTITYIALFELLLLRKCPLPLRRGFWLLVSWSALFVVPLTLAVVFREDLVAMIYDSPVYTRDYSHRDRLASELVILWDYLKVVAIPRVSEMGPYHDGHQVYTWRMWEPWVSLLVWVLLIGFLSIIAKRHQLARIFLFAGLMYLGGHQVESSFLLLELYFEHRNYLPVLGFVMAFAVLLDCARRKLGGWLVPATLLFAVLAFNAFSVQQLAVIWGQPLAAAELWYKEQPHSGRAAQALSRQYLKHGYRDAGIEVLDNLVERTDGTRLDIAIQSMVQVCKTEPAELIEERVQLLYGGIPVLTNALGITTGIASLGDAVRAGDCFPFSPRRYQHFLEELSRQEKVSQHRAVMHHVYFERALMANQFDNFDEYVSLMKQSYYAIPTLTIAQKISAELFSHNRVKEALEWLDIAVEYAPSGIQGRVWERTLGSMKDALSRVLSKTGKYNP